MFDTTSLDLFYYILLAVVYIMTISLAVSISRQFEFFALCAFFIFGGIVGFMMDSYITGFVLAVVLHLVLW